MQMDAEFAGKTVIVTGATSGIGRATALRFGAVGANVVLVGRDADALGASARDVVSRGGQPLPLRADLSSEEEAGRVVREVLASFGRVDVLVNAAGHISSGTIETTTLEAWEAMLNINLRAPFILMQQVTPHLCETRGCVVNVSSVTGLRAFPGVLAYCVSKAALDQLTRCAALELAPRGVRVNAVNPGVVVTEIHKRGGMSATEYSSFLERSKQTHPLGRVGQAEEIAELV
jgi:NAD(P)-dependent dehydrogenase (short-subunit alcohol dehydrogenase family)